MNKVKIKKSISKVLISDFSKFSKRANNIDDALACRNIYNFKTDNGKLESGMGISYLMVRGEDNINSYQYRLDLGLEDRNFNKVMYFKQYFKHTGDTAHRLLFHCSDNKLYMFELFSNTNELTWVYELEFDTIPAVLEYKKGDLDSILISSTNKLVVWTTDQTPYEITGVPTITSMCEYNDILYCTTETDSEKVWYTQSLDPSNIGKEDEYSSHIILDAGIGGGVKVIQFNESIYVFCDYGIYRINTYAQDKPAVRLIYSTTSRITPNTITPCGAYILFASTEGVYRFNGDTVLKVDELSDLLKGANNSYATATYFHGCYYLATSMDFGDHKIIGCEDMATSILKNNALIKFDLSDKTCEFIRGVDVRDMLPLHAGSEEKIICTFNSLDMYRVGEISDSGDVFEDVFERTYRTNYFTPQNMESVTIRKVSIDSSARIQVRIIVDDKTTEFIMSENGYKTFNTYIPCKKFQLEIVSLGKEVYVNSVEIEYIK